MVEAGSHLAARLVVLRAAHPADQPELEYAPNILAALNISLADLEAAIERISS